jgi:hypothetical protein
MSTIKVDTITSSDGLGAPELPYGLAISAAFTLNGAGNAYINRSVNSGSLTFAGGTGIDAGQTSGGLIARGSTDSYNAGGVEVYAGGSERLVINSAGNATFSGVITTDGMTTSADINFGDSDKAIFGAGSDLQIYHDGTNSYISDQGTNDLKVLATDFQLKNSADNEFMMTAVTDGAVTLYHNNAAKLATTATGIDVTGGVTATSLKATDNINIQADDAQLYLTNAANTDYFLIKRTGASGDLAFDHFNGSTVSERLRITSAGRVGIGTSSPSALLDSRGFSVFGDQANGIVYLTTPSSSEGRIGTGGRTSVTPMDLTFYTSDSGSNQERMRITSAGNVGIGTSSPSDVLDVFGSILSSGTTQNRSLRLVNNSGTFEIAHRADISATIISTSATPLIISSSAELTFGTAGTERARIDSSGNVGIGTSSPASKLDVQTASATNGGATFGVNGTMVGTIGTGGFSVNGGALTDFGIRAANNMLFSTGSGAPERMRIDSAGNVGIGTASPQQQIHVYRNTTDGTSAAIKAQNAGASASYALFDATAGSVQTILYSDAAGNALGVAGASLRTVTNHPLIFGTNNTERARIDSSGNLLVGTTSTLESAVVSVYKSGLNGFAARITNNAFWNFVGINASNVRTFLVYGDGDVENTNNSYGAISDSRFKSNIVDASSQIEDVMAMKVRRYTLDSTGATHIGVIAQELEESGMSGLVKENLDGTKAVRYSVLYMKAVKALQEAIARIETLEAEVAALKGAN